MLVEMLISSLCSTTPSIYVEACSKASTAGTMHWGVMDTDNRLESYASNKMTSAIGLAPIIVTVLAYKAYKTHEVKYNFNVKRYNIIGIGAISTDVNIRMQTESVGLVWSF